MLTTVAKSFTRNAVNKRERKLKQQLQSLEDQVVAMRKTAQQQQRREEERVASVLMAVDDAAEQQRLPALSAPPAPLRGPNDHYSPAFQMMCAEVMSHEVSARAAGPAIASVLSWETGVPMKPPSERSLGRWERKAGLVAEAVVAQAILEHEAATGQANALLQYDETSKHDQSYHTTGIALPLHGRFTLGIQACPSKSAADQLEASSILRSDIMRSGEAILGVCTRDPLSLAGAVLTDGGPTEEAVRRELEKKKIEQNKTQGTLPLNRW